MMGEMFEAFKAAGLEVSLIQVKGQVTVNYYVDTNEAYVQGAGFFEDVTVKEVIKLANGDAPGVCENAIF